LPVRPIALCALAATAGLLLAAGSAARSDPFSAQAQLHGTSTKFFGVAVALSANGTTALVGAPNSGYDSRLKTQPHGSAWVFHQGGGGNWSGGFKLTGGTTFGSSVALSANGRIAVVGGPGHDDKKGIVWVFTTRGGNTWVGQQLKATGVGYRAEYGSSVAISADGSTILVGAKSQKLYDGAVWTFVRSGSRWKQMGGALTAKSPKGHPQFGTRVALSGDGKYALVTGPQDNERRGAAWALVRSGSSWKQTKLENKYGKPKDEFGADLALSTDGHRALISAPGALGFGSAGKPEGRVYLYGRAGSTWTQTSSLSEPLELNGHRHPGFGTRVALSRDGRTALVGGATNDSGTQRATWVFPGQGTSFKLETYGPLAASGNGEVAVVGTSQSEAATVFAIAPTVQDIAPHGGPTAGGTQVTIKGNDFKNVRAVLFGNIGAPSFTVDAQTQITAVSPPTPAGQVAVKVVTANATSAEAYYGHFTYFDRPVVTAVTPVTGSTAGGTTVTITGLNFRGATAVRFGATAAESFKVDSATQITAVSPPAPAGVVDVTVTTLGGTSATSAADGFTYVAPVVEKVITFDNLTTGGPGGAGTLVVVNSQYAGQSVTFNDFSAIDYSKGGSAIPNFARSGTVAVEQCVGVEFCTTPIKATFTPAQKRVRVWVGFSFRLDSPLTIELKAFDGSGGTLGTATATLPANPSPTPIRTPIEVQVGSALIKSVQVAVPGGYMNAVAVDSVTFAQ